MEKQEQVTMEPEERLRRAARFFAMGAIRAALRKQGSVAGQEAREQAGTDRDQTAAGDPPGRLSAVEDASRKKQHLGDESTAGKKAPRTTRHRPVVQNSSLHGEVDSEWIPQR